MSNINLIDKLNVQGQLSLIEWDELITNSTKEDFDYSKDLAHKIAFKQFGNQVFFRGIIEFTNICKNDCNYCGIRKSNSCVSRYRLSKSDILACCEEGYKLGFKTFVLQGGEDGFFTDEILCDIVSDIHTKYPSCAITLSIGERSKQSYQSLYDAGADRFLLRHETADNELYGKLHPSYQTLKNRLECLNNLKNIGFQTGCGCMIGAPFQTPHHLAIDMHYMCEFHPQMIGMGPFIPHKDTPFKEYPAGSVETTLYLLSLSRIAMHEVLLPATTALGTLENDGRIQGILHGANVIMPNLSPMSVRQKYMLYDNKIGTQTSTKQSLDNISNKLKTIGYTLSKERGDYIGKE